MFYYSYALGQQLIPDNWQPVGTPGTPPWAVTWQLPSRGVTCPFLIVWKEGQTCCCAVDQEVCSRMRCCLYEKCGEDSMASCCRVVIESPTKTTKTNRCDGICYGGTTTTSPAQPCTRWSRRAFTVVGNVLMHCIPFVGCYFLLVQQWLQK